MRFLHNASILIATLTIGTGRAEAQDPWDPQASQGIHLQTGNFEWIYVDSAKNNNKAITAPDGVLTVAGNQNFLGTLLATIPTNTGTAKLGVRIKASYPHENPYKDPSYPQAPPSPAKKEYQIEYGNGKPLCEGNNRALAIPGSYSTTQKGIYDVFRQNDNRVSFACIPTKAEGKKPWAGRAVLTGGGVAAKCVDWGYPPWFFLRAPWVKPGSGTSPANEAAAQSIHQTCLFMGTADYCGNGKPQTVDGTWIGKFNDRTVRSRDQVIQGTGTGQDGFLKGQYVNNFFFEAAWRPSPLREHGPGGAYCLTKKRWATMPLGLSSLIAANKCPSLQQAEFCHETEEDLVAKEHVLLFSYSLFLDVGLFRCSTNPINPSLWLTATTDELTDNLSWNTQGTLYKYQEQNQPFVFECSNNEFEGAALGLRAEGSPLPEKFPMGWTGTTRPVTLYRHWLGGGTYLTDTNDKPMNANDHPKSLGYILPAASCPGPFCGESLKLYQSGNQYLTTTASNFLPGPFAGLAGQGQVLGYLIDLKK
jgi:hypothetical protein